MGASALPASLDSGVDIPEKHRRGSVNGEVEGQWSSEELAAGAHHTTSDSGPVDTDYGTMGP